LELLATNAELELRDYVGMMPEMNDGELVIDDISEYETEKLIEIYKPDIICAGIKEKFSIQKAGIPSKQLHSYDYGGPYAGYEGAINFYREIDRMLHIKAYSHLTAPWQAAPPELKAMAAD
jgi:nitrogenase molybdenum-iron protein alpha chain